MYRLTRSGNVLRRLRVGCPTSGAKTQARYYSEPPSQTPVEFFNQMRSDLRTFPEYFNPVTYVIFATIMVYLLFLTSNGRGRNWMMRNFSLDFENLSKGRVHTVLTHSILETSAITLMVNLFMIRWGGNIVLNMGGGTTGFYRAFGLLTIVPGSLYSLVSGFAGKQSQEQDWLQLGNAVVPSSHFNTNTVSGMHAVSAGLVANGVLEVGSAFGKSTLAVPLLGSLYLLMAVGGSTDSWLALSGMSTAIIFRSVTKRGF